MMKYISTRGNAPELTFEEVLLTGLAEDGGLYVPKDVPTFSKEEIEDILIVKRNQEEFIQRQEEEQDEIDRPIPPVQSPKDNVVQMRKRTSSI